MEINATQVFNQCHDLRKWIYSMAVYSDNELLELLTKEEIELQHTELDEIVKSFIDEINELKKTIHDLINQYSGDSK